MTQTAFIKPLTQVDAPTMKVLKEIVQSMHGVEYVDVREDMLALEVVFDEKKLEHSEFVGRIGEETGIRVEVRDR